MANILVVDDDPLVIECITDALEHCGHSVYQARNGVEGIAIYKDGGVDLVITDLIMPEEEGLGMIRRLRKLNPDVRIIAISGGGRTGNADFLKMAGKLGAVGTVCKPIRLADLLHAVNTGLAPNLAPT